VKFDQTGGDFRWKRKENFERTNSPERSSILGLGLNSRSRDRGAWKKRKIIMLVEFLGNENAPFAGYFVGSNSNGGTDLIWGKRTKKARRPWEESIENAQR